MVYHVAAPKVHVNKTDSRQTFDAMEMLFLLLVAACGCVTGRPRSEGTNQPLD